MFRCCFQLSIAENKYVNKICGLYIFFTFLYIRAVAYITWWRHAMENAFRVTGPLWGLSTGHRWIPRTKGQ